MGEVDRPLDDLGLQEYDSVRAQRPDSRADGCVIAWKRNEFKMECKEVISFDEHLPSDEGQDVQRFRRGNCAVVAELRRNGGQSFVVATAHLCWEAEHEDVRKLQAEVLLRALEVHSKRVGHRAILCGDLNAMPGCASHASITATLQSVYRDLEAAGTVTNSNACAGSAVIVRENGHRATNSGSKSVGFAGMLDYLCLDPHSATALSRLRLPDCDELRSKLGGGPSEALPTLLCRTWPSDHLPVAADISFTVNWQ